MKLHEITTCLETFAPPAWQEDYDNSGLLVKAGDDIHSALVALDCTEPVIDEAKSLGCNLIITHHPIIFRGLKRLTGSNYVERTVMKALQEGISLYAIHTNLDNVHLGVNQKISERLGLKNTQILQPKENLLKKLVTFVPHANAAALRDALSAAGTGHIGDYSDCSFNLEGYGIFRGQENTNPYVGKPGELHREEETRIETIYPAYLESRVIQALYAVHPYEEPAFDLYALDNRHARAGSGMYGELPSPVKTEEFLLSVKETFQCGIIKHTAIHKPDIQRIAVCGGSGFFLLKEAVRTRADVFITSDVKYHEFFDADGKIILCDIGHYESEQYTSDLIVDVLVKNFPTFAVRISRINTNPVKYL